MTERDEQRQPTVPEISGYYDQGAEQDRLQGGRSRLERARTQEILRRRLPPAPAVILDVGGGPGVYAFWLAGLGYEVHLRDAMPLHIEQARQAAHDQPDHPLASAEVGDARQLDRPDATADVVLLMGPLYHLTERADRLLALREARRVVKPDGLIFAVGISRFTSLCDGLMSGYLDDPAFRAIVEEDLRSGQHRNPSSHAGYFTTAYFHHPDELQAEVREAGLAIEEIVGIEGPSWWLISDFASWWDDSERRERLLAASRAVEHEPTLLGLGPHLMVVARKS